MVVWRRRLRGLREEGSALGGLNLEVEGVAWDQGRMGMVGLGEEVVREGVGTLGGKGLFRLGSGEEGRGFLKGHLVEEVGAMAVVGLGEGEVGTKKFNHNDTN
jgi:hypothetical protein